MRFFVAVVVDGERNAQRETGILIMIRCLDLGDRSAD